MNKFINCHFIAQERCHPKQTKAGEDITTTVKEISTTTTKTKPDEEQTTKDGSSTTTTGTPLNKDLQMTTFLKVNIQCCLFKIVI